MREIQFRVWDSYNKKMIPTEGGFSLGSADSEMVGGPDYPVMQYTGLKDKNGKEIYEGDIIKLYPSDKSGIQILWDEHIAGFGFGNQTMADHLNFRKLTAINYEVIGNIYENPELLEAK